MRSNFGRDFDDFDRFQNKVLGFGCLAGIGGLIFYIAIIAAIAVGIVYVVNNV